MNHQMEEVRVDLRIKNKERKEEGIRSETLCFKLSQLEPTDPKIQELVKELLNGQIGENSVIKPPVFINLGKNVHIGSNVVIMPGFRCMSAGGLWIEDDTRIGLSCAITTNNHDFYERDILTCRPVVIKRDVWIGMNVTILPGITIGNHAVVGAGSVVTHDVKDYEVVAGNPARVIRKLDPENFS